MQHLNAMMRDPAECVRAFVFWGVEFRVQGSRVRDASRSLRCRVFWRFRVWDKFLGDFMTKPSTTLALLAGNTL